MITICFLGKKNMLLPTNRNANVSTSLYPLLHCLFFPAMTCLFFYLLQANTSGMWICIFFVFSFCVSMRNPAKTRIRVSVPTLL
ncbi:uncharacterized protein BYT42DRAFT_88223 [Radiomyces spectabilis]|uniref:uncharacterized protein n=1 Tax=Radiomyces spectabilis TaxID=64574 RepID=UPI00221EA6A8|nr:uncharacterized protein BYT42DRAFT_88223 [Radiomyces spectabilis]KAI8370424.1 hypothetical protein BYT42DRAFT_88223 [Radiomyces spectabilis]